jgi:flagella basal body P-ring formation protein FlgA
MTAQGRAMASAARGEVVPVMNLASRSIVEGQAIGPGRVRFAFGSTPVSR